MKYVYAEKNKRFKHNVRFEANTYEKKRALTSRSPVYAPHPRVHKHQAEIKEYLDESLGKCSKDWGFSRSLLWADGRDFSGQWDVYGFSYSFKTEEQAMWFILRWGQILDEEDPS